MFLRKKVFSYLHYNFISTSTSLRAGHNKWSKVKRQKEVLDPRRSLVFARIRNQIATAVKLGGGPDPTLNSALVKAIEKAKEVKMPKSTIEKCLSSSSAETSERYIFEVRGNSGYLLLVETVTEHKHRHNIRAELKRILERNSRGVIAEPGSFNFMFDKKGIISATASGELLNRDPLEIAIECGAEDLLGNDDDQDADTLQFVCEVADIKDVTQAAESLGLTIMSSRINYVPNTTIGLNEMEYDKAIGTVEDLSNHENVLEIYDNFYLDNE